MGRDRYWCDLAAIPGLTPLCRTNAAENAASDPYPTRVAMLADVSCSVRSKVIARRIRHWKTYSIGGWPPEPPSTPGRQAIPAHPATRP